MISVTRPSVLNSVSSMYSRCVLAWFFCWWARLSRGLISIRRAPPFTSGVLWWCIAVVLSIIIVGFGIPGWGWFPPLLVLARLGMFSVLGLFLTLILVVSPPPVFRSLGQVDATRATLVLASYPHDDLCSSVRDLVSGFSLPLWYYIAVCVWL